MPNSSQIEDYLQLTAQYLQFPFSLRRSKVYSLQLTAQYLQLTAYHFQLTA